MKLNLNLILAVNLIKMYEISIIKIHNIAQNHRDNVHISNEFVDKHIHLKVQCAACCRNRNIMLHKSIKSHLFMNIPLFPNPDRTIVTVGNIIDYKLNHLTQNIQ